MRLARLTGSYHTQTTISQSTISSLFLFRLTCLSFNCVYNIKRYKSLLACVFVVRHTRRLRHRDMRRRIRLRIYVAPERNVIRASLHGTLTRLKTAKTTLFYVVHLISIHKDRHRERETLFRTIENI